MLAFLPSDPKLILGETGQGYENHRLHSGYTSMRDQFGPLAGGIRIVYLQTPKKDGHGERKHCQKPLSQGLGFPVVVKVETRRKEKET